MGVPARRTACKNAYAAPRHAPVALWRLVLYIEQHKVCPAQNGVIAAKPHARRVQAGVYARLPAQPQALAQKARLQKRFAAGKCHAARGPVIGLVAQQFFHKLLRLGGSAVRGGPGVRVVAVTAPQRAPLQEHHRAHTGPVHIAHRFNGMKVTYHMPPAVCGQNPPEKEKSRTSRQNLPRRPAT